MDIIYKGVALGFVLAITIGPVFFKLLQISVRKGWSHGFFFVVGITLSDVFYAFAAFFGLSAILEKDSVQFYLALVGGLILIVYGFVSLFAAQKPLQKPEDGKNSYGSELISGLVINGLNPFVLLFWVGVISIATVEFQMETEELPWLLVTILVTNLCFDIAKVLVANRLRRAISVKQWRSLSKLVGVALFLFGLRLIYFAVSI